jgi:4-hydroxy-tetrahydrodipicolinate synthase
MTELIVVVPTFFDYESNIDFGLMYDHLKYLLHSGVTNFVFQGTTSETPTLSSNEIREINHKLLGMLSNLTSDNSKLKQPKMIFGVGGFNTRQVIEDIENYRYYEFADMVMLSAPYYNKPTQEGIFQHYKLITERFPDTKFMVYNVPSRTGVNIEPLTMTRICYLPNVVAIKEASGNMSQIMEVNHLLKLNKLDKVKLYSGDDGLTLPVLSIGGCGIISVLGNLMPKTMLRMLNSNESDRIIINNDLVPFYKLLFVESNPVPLKYLLSLKYQDKTYYNVRLPLVGLSEKSKEQLDYVYEKYVDNSNYVSDMKYNKYSLVEENV